MASRTPVAILVEFEGRTGYTINVSSTGVYFVVPPPLEVPLDLEFTLVFDAARRQPTRFNCRARLVRVDVDGSTIGIAASIEAFGIDAGRRAENSARFV